MTTVKVETLSVKKLGKQAASSLMTIQLDVGILLKAWRTRR